MQQWEHHFAEISGVVQPGSRQQQTLSAVNEMGRQGWEMVAVFEHIGRIWAAFKRPLESVGVKDAARSMGQAARAKAE